MQTIEQAGDLSGKRVLMRTDFDVPVVDGKIQETFRIERQRAMFQGLVAAGAKVTLIAHISAVPSFDPLISQVEAILGGPITLLENTRAHLGEKANDVAYAQSLAHDQDIFVNNAFSVCHRMHASVAGVAKLLPSYAGDVIIEEVAALRDAIEAPATGKVVVIGGAKASTKVPVIRSLMQKAETILVGGVVANDVLKVRGVDVGASLVDADADVLLAGVDVNDPRLQVPIDFIRDQEKILDIGLQTVAQYAQFISSAQMVVWNGPMGMFEDERFAAGTRAIVEAIARSSARSIIGGGDSVTAAEMFGIKLERFGFVSTGGGAMLSFLAGERLPGLDVLGYYR